MVSSAALLNTVIYAAFVAGILQLRASAAPAASQWFPWSVLVLFLIVAVPTTLQFAVPALLPALERDTRRVLAGEVWRIITALTVQDGGVFGSVFNLVNLLMIGTVAAALWRSNVTTIGIFFAGGILSELVALAWQPVGAGNSVANYSLAGSVCALCLLRGRGIPARIAAIIALLAALPLLWQRDIHGAAVVFGVVLGGAVLWTKRTT